MFRKLCSALLSKWPIGARDKSCGQARDSKCWVCDYDVRDIWDIRCGQYLPDISTLHYTRSQPPCRDSNLQGLSKNEIFSLLLLLLPDLIWSLEIISRALTLLSKYVNIIANYFLAPCTFYFRLKIEFVFLKSDNQTILQSSALLSAVLLAIYDSEDQSDWWSQCWSICWEQAITLPRTIMLCYHSLSLSSPIWPWYAVIKCIAHWPPPGS